MNAELPLFAKPVAPRGAVAKIVHEVLAGVLPPGVPPPFVEVVSATMTGQRRERRIRCDLRMIDGLPAVVVLTRWALGWSIRYHDMPGGALSWERGRWLRVNEDSTR